MFFLIIVFLLGKKQGSYRWCCVNLFIPAGIIMGTKRLNMLCQSRCEEQGEDWVILLGERKEQNFQISRVGHFYLFLIPERRLWR